MARGRPRKTINKIQGTANKGNGVALTNTGHKSEKSKGKSQLQSLLADLSDGMMPPGL
ncbi:hypothetical protein HAX54_022639, partial [Datura stramonium]|nr:hypothetical protein [Datura stramonium]